MSDNTICIITGANRGIGRALVASYLLRPNHTVVAAVRDPSHATSASLPELAVAEGSKLIVQKLNSLSEEDFANLPGGLAAQGVTKLDVVVANAGHSSGFKNILEITPENLKYDFEVNTITNLRVFQALWPLVEKSTAESGKKWVMMTSALGSIDLQDKINWPVTSYGISKAGINFLARKVSLDFKEQGLLAIALHPGWVKTDMGQLLADHVGTPEPPMDMDTCITGLLKVIDNMSAENSGKMVDWEGKVVPW
jgi:norsolorinic acid ketoreductase